MTEPLSNAGLNVGTRRATSSIAKAALITLALTIASLPWQCGGVFASSYLLLGFAAIAACVALLLAFVFSTRIVPPLPAGAWLLLLAALWGALQLCPLPTAMMQRLSPQKVAWKMASRIDAADQPRFDCISAAPERTRGDLAKLSVLALVLGAASLSSSFQLIKALLWMLAGNGLLLIVVGIVQRLMGSGYLLSSLPTRHTMSFAGFVNHNNAGGYLCLVLATFVACWVVDGLPRWRLGATSDPQHRWYDLLLADWRDYAFALLLLAGVVAVLFTASRGAFLGMLAGGVAMLSLVTVISQRRFGTAFVAVVVFAGLFIAWCGLSDQIWGRLATIVDPEELESVRALHWRDDIHTMRDYRWTGCGIGTYRFVNRSYQSFPLGASPRRWFLYSENQYLESAIVAGIPGVLILAGLLVWLCRTTLRLAQRRTTVAAAVAVLGVGALVSQVVAAGFDFGLYHSANGALFACIAGLVAATLHLDASPGKSTAGSRDEMGERNSNRLSPWNLVGWTLLLFWGLGSIPNLYGQFQIEPLVAQVDSALNRSVDTQRPLAEMNGHIVSLKKALAWIPDHTLGNLALAELYLEKNQVELFAEMQRGSSGTDAKQAWAAASIANLHAKAHQLARSGNDLRPLAASPIIHRNLQAAWQALEKARAACPHVAAVYLEQSWIRLLATGDPSASEPALSLATRLLPQSPSVRFQAASIALAEGLQELGQQLFAESIHLQGALTDEHVQFASVALTPEQFAMCVRVEDVQTTLERALDASLTCGLPEHHVAVVDAALRQLRETPSSQLDAADKAFAEYQLHSSIRRLTLAGASLARAVRERPSRLDWRYLWARWLLDRQDYEAALQQAELCVAQEPNNRSCRALARQIRALSNQAR